MNEFYDCCKHALNILSELHASEKELVGKGVILSDGKAGTIDHVFVDDIHGLRIGIGGHEGRWPIATIKQLEEER
ncbi:PRC-barrel domain containing protein [Bradyrhizobium pachyrhizi]|uniref:PRC-barrel domain containing protein n=1 Tax=Bradyrhizobium TaxID=374 RepID=UPI0024B15FF5|nr:MULTISPECIES: PRC-barrel domain containing protein [Bradyrhizobium]WFU54789.1 PRC-barrel domain containing protein [Bradyrhizobium pachyrhizi]WOH80583.1 PRC-barrel domain containing protein [Bradyrhizobium sp. BEA-2-5]